VDSCHTTGEHHRNGDHQRVERSSPELRLPVRHETNLAFARGPCEMRAARLRVSSARARRLKALALGLSHASVRHQEVPAGTSMNQVRALAPTAKMCSNWSMRGVILFLTVVCVAPGCRPR